MKPLVDPDKVADPEQAPFGKQLSGRAKSELLDRRITAERAQGQGLSIAQAPFRRNLEEETEASRAQSLLLALNAEVGYDRWFLVFLGTVHSSLLSQ